MAKYEAFSRVVKVPEQEKEAYVIVKVSNVMIGSESEIYPREVCNESKRNIDGKSRKPKTL